MENEQLDQLRQRRCFLQKTACGIGSMALGELLAQEGSTTPLTNLPDPLRPKPTHFQPRAKNVIFIFMAGAPSQLDLFNPKPKMKHLLAVANA